MKIAIRTDSSQWIGSGHVMRCLVLANELKARAHDVVFYCLSQPGDLITFIQNQGFKVIQLSVYEHAEQSVVVDDYRTWLKGTEEDDAAVFLAALSKTGTDIDWVITDHYAIGLEWQKCIRQKTGAKILAIDDLNRLHAAEIILDQNYWPDMHSRYINGTSIRLLGPKFALLRESFSLLRNNKNIKRSRVLAFFGGSDPTNECEKLVLASLGIPKLPFELIVVAGRQNENYDRLREITRQSDVFIVKYLDDFDVHLAQALYAIGASGTTNWERFCLGIPASIVSVADNQVKISEYLASKGFVRYLGSASNTTVTTYQKELEFLSRKPWKTIICPPKVDGLGVQRVANAIEEFQ